MYLLRSPVNAKRLFDSIAELNAIGGVEHERSNGEGTTLVAIVRRLFDLLAGESKPFAEVNELVAERRVRSF
jgi:hypothetical protein